MVYTIGHSTRSLESFVQLIKACNVTMVVDVRTVPRSRHNSQFNLETLPEKLAASGISYEHLAGLGGLRKTARDSPNMGWRNTSFRGFADYMGTAEFEHNLEKLIELSRQEHVAVMCAEAVPWRCHRSLIADALSVRGIAVEHLISSDRGQPHKLTPWARVKGMKITYPGEAAADGLATD